MIIIMYYRTSCISKEYLHNYISLFPPFDVVGLWSVLIVIQSTTLFAHNKCKAVKSSRRTGVI